MSIQSINTNQAVQAAAAAAAGGPSSSGSSSNAQPNTNLSTAQAVAIAVNKLSKTALANLWEEKVTSVSWYAKIPGLISYLWNRSTAVSADQAHGATIEKFNKISQELVVAVANRRFTPAEAAQRPVPQVRLTNADEQLELANLQLKAEQKLEEFYAVFKERVTQLNVNDNEYPIYALAAQKTIEDISKSEKMSGVSYSATLPIRIKTTLEEFNAKIYDDMAASFANQPLADIKIDSFKQKAALIKECFKAIDSVDIEMKLRQAIKANHNDVTEFNTVIAEYTQAGNSPRFVAARTAIEAQLTADRPALQAELDALRGTSGLNGTLHDAWTAKQTAQQQMDTAYNALIVAFRAPAGSLNSNDRTAALALITQFLANTNAASTSGVTNITTLQTLVQDYQQKAVAYNAADQAHAALQARFNEIAQYQPGTATLCGGKLFLINTNLQPLNLDSAARAETEKMANFYRELNQVVGDNNKVVRSNALHAIIDP